MTQQRDPSHPKSSEPIPGELEASDSQPGATPASGEKESALQSLFDAATALGADQRAEFLEGQDPAVRSQVEKLLRAHDAMGDFLHESVTLGDAAPQLAPGADVGPYVLTRVLGEGGFGTVYEAEQHEPLRRTVALKVIRAGMDSEPVIARFAAEREALARMDHPHIARVLDAGVTELGRPFFVMERVVGTPITDYCDEAQLSLTERLGLVRQTCAAVQHAHQRGVVHRDLKPSNIMVTVVDGAPSVRVIDFGIAKALHADGLGDGVRTEAHHRLGTPAYMSPEQTVEAGTDVDTRSDVYSLGVVLYELLTGTTPHPRATSGHSPISEVYQRIRTTEPDRPSKRVQGRSPQTAEVRARRELDLNEIARQRSTDLSTLERLLVRDLDWVVMKAIARAPELRYDSASQLSDDLQRYLQGNPVEARPPSHLYRWRKTVQRHRLLFGAGTTIALLLIGSVAVLSSIALELDRQRQLAQDAEANANRERTLAETAREESDAVTRFLTEMLADLSPYRSGPDVKVREVLESAAREIDDRFEASLTLRARVQHTIAAAYYGLGLYLDALPHIQAAAGIRDDALGLRSYDARQSRTLHAQILRGAGRFEIARSLLDDLIEIESDIAASDVERFTTRYEHAATILDQGRYLEAVAELKELRSQIRSRNENSEAAESASLRSIEHRTAAALGHGYERLGNLAAAEECLRVVVDAEDDRPADIDHADATHKLAIVQMRRGKVAEAIADTQATLERRSQLLGPEHPSTMNARLSVAWIQVQMGNVALAEPELEQLVKDATRLLGPDDHRTARYQVGLAGLRFDQKRWAESEVLMRQIVDVFSKTYGFDHPNTIAERHRLGISIQRQGHAEKAESIFLELLTQAQSSLGDAHPTTLKLRMSLGLIYSKTGRYSKAEAESQAAIDGLTLALGPENSATLGARTNLAGVYKKQKRFEEAQALLESTLEIKRRVLGPKASFTRSCMYSLIQVYGATQQWDPAVALALEYLDLQVDVLGPDHRSTQNARDLLERMSAGAERS